MHYPDTSGCLEFENLFVASQSPLEEEGKSCMQEKSMYLENKGLNSDCAFSSCNSEFHSLAVPVSILLPESKNSLTLLLKLFF